MPNRHRFFGDHTIIQLFLLLLCSSAMVNGQESGEPRLVPCEYSWDGIHLEMRYQGHVILKVELENPGSLDAFNTLSSDNDGKVDQVL
jgi:hypothetical protein